MRRESSLGFLAPAGMIRCPGRIPRLLGKWKNHSNTTSSVCLAVAANKYSWFLISITFGHRRRLQLWLLYFFSCPPQLLSPAAECQMPLKCGKLIKNALAWDADWRSRKNRIQTKCFQSQVQLPNKFAWMSRGHKARQQQLRFRTLREIKGGNS